MIWTDAHCHLDFLPDPPGAMARAEAAGVGRWLLPGTEPSQWLRARDRFGPDPRVRLAFGHHPWFLPEVEPDTRSLTQSLVDWPDAVAIGEIGLDFHAGSPPRPPAEHQEHWFEAQLQVAEEQDRPVIIHSVKAHDRVLHYLKRYPAVRGVIHAFVGPYEQARAFADKGWCLGCGSLILKSSRTLDAFARLPDEAILLETDAPDMRPPRPLHDNPLLDLLQTADGLAEARGQSSDALMQATDANLSRLFQNF